MIDRLVRKGLNAELIATLLFSILSFLYLVWRFGPEKILDTLFLWMFPASVMIFLTLLIAKIIESWHSRTVRGHQYVDWRK